MVSRFAQETAPQIRAARKARGLTQAQLAQAVGVSRQTILSLECGDYSPSVYLALRFRAALGATVEDLFGPPAPGHDTTEHADAKHTDLQ